ncbi:MAG: alpha/beta hydrolase [Anaerolineales bacterium]|nr:alpha/beta hydrolase [Anaerolineales bacterium]
MHIPLFSQPHPASDYETAVSRYHALHNRHTPEPLNPLSRDILLTHGGMVEKAIVLFHGLTSSPRQFAQLGELLHQHGFNVLIPRVPFHGHADTMTTALSQLKATQVAALANEAVDIAQGLGRRVFAMGLSMGGVMTGWVTQFRADVEATALISPVFGLHVVPATQTRLLTEATLRLPNRFMWWDPEMENRGPGAKHAYPRFPTHALAQVLRLGFAVQDGVRRGETAVRRILFITNPNDEAVSSPMIAQVRHRWAQQPGVVVQSYVFDKALALNHDLIEPEHPQQNVTAVYPILLDLIANLTR